MSKFIAVMPWHLMLDEQPLDATMYQATPEIDGETFHCEYAETICTSFDIMFGTSDEREPKFCPYHYFKMNKLGHDSATNYQLVIGGIKD